MTTHENITFAELGLSLQMLASLEKKGFEKPSAIQEQVIPLLLNGDKNVIGQAATGTGKTAAFGIPLLETLLHESHPQALIMVPTRELAIQVAEEINSLQADLKNKLSIVSIYGGQSYDIQLRALKKGVDIVVGTPGRIIDHLHRKTLKLQEISYMILDEADEMLNMGFVDDIEEIFKQTNEDKKVLLFSATMPKVILNVAKKYMGDYQLVSVQTTQMTTTQTTQIYFEVRESDKFEALCRIIDIESDFYGIVFCKTKLDCDFVTTKLNERGYQAQGLHGDVQQKQRERILKSFKDRKVKILVATDVAARGIDVNDISHVINYSLPQDTESYVHRVGRTGRAGKTGKAITFVTPQEYRKIVLIQKVTKTDIQKGSIPSTDEIMQARRLKLKADIDSVLAGQKYQQYSEVANYLLENFTPEAVVAALLKLNYQDGLTPDSFKQINEVSIDTTGTSRLFIALGRKGGYTPRSLVDFIQTEAGVSPRDIDDVRVMEDFSFVTVPFADAEVILHVFAKQNKGGRSLVSKAKDKTPQLRAGRDSDGGSRGGYSSRGGRDGRGDRSFGASRAGGSQRSFSGGNRSDDRGFRREDKASSYGRGENAKRGQGRRR
ncbi:RNA helicase [candidate division SR1 bacterium]|nr:RNA helicase [candidate division SR1 bacterium]